MIAHLPDFLSPTSVGVTSWSVLLEATFVVELVVGSKTPLPEYMLVTIPTETVAATFRHELSLELPTVSIPSTPEFPAASVIATIASL